MARGWQNNSDTFGWTRLESVRIILLTARVGKKRLKHISLVPTVEVLRQRKKKTLRARITLKARFAEQLRVSQHVAGGSQPHPKFGPEDTWSVPEN